MKMLVLNVHSAHNAGDLAILETTINVLRNVSPHASITVAINDLTAAHPLPDATYVGSFMHWVMDVDKAGEWHWNRLRAIKDAAWLIVAMLLYRITGWRWRRRDPAQQQLVDAYADANVIVVVGGGHLYARHALNIAFAWLWLGLMLAPLLGKPLWMMPQSYGPLPGRMQRHMLRLLINRCSFVATREYRSAQLLATIGCAGPIVVIPDLAFSSPVQTSHSKPHHVRPHIGLTLMDWQAQNPDFKHQARYERAILTLIADAQRKYDAHITLFAQCTGPTAAQDDRIIARRIRDHALEQGVIVEVMDDVLSSATLRNFYGQLDLLVATRMHSAIFALSEYVPTIAIGYLHKTIGIMDMLGLGQYSLDINEISETKLVASFEALWNARNLVQERLNATIPAIRSTISHLPVLLAKDYD